MYLDQIIDEISPLNSLLEKIGSYHPMYGGGLATHLPMVLIALSKLEAPNEKLLKTFNEGLDELEPIGSLDNVVAVEHVDKELGNSDSYTRYLKYYQQELLKHGVKKVLENSLPILISGIGASAFHGLIRLAYAVEVNCQSEIAIALAYWSAEYQPFELNETTTDEQLESILVRLFPLGVNHRFSPGIIVDRMNEVGDLLKRNESIIQPVSIDLVKLRQFALKSFYLCNDFTLLHTVTGCHAFSIILPFITDKKLALRELWKAIVVAYLSTGLEYKNEHIPVQQRDYNFDLISEKALASEDSHIIKLTYTCRSEYQKWKNPLYYWVAHRAVMKLRD